MENILIGVLIIILLVFLAQMILELINSHRFYKRMEKQVDELNEYLEERRKNEEK